MKIHFIDGQEFRTQLPVVGKIEGAHGVPRVWLVGVGDVPVRREARNYHFEFHLMSAGNYRLQVRDDVATWEKSFYFEEQKFLNFGMEFGVFLVLFLFFILGVIRWTKWAMRS